MAQHNACAALPTTGPAPLSTLSRPASAPALPLPAGLGCVPTPRMQPGSRTSSTCGACTWDTWRTPLPSSEWVGGQLLDLRCSAVLLLFHAVLCCAADSSCVLHACWPAPCLLFVTHWAIHPCYHDLSPQGAAHPCRQVSDQADRAAEAQGAGSGAAAAEALQRWRHRRREEAAAEGAWPACGRRQRNVQPGLSDKTPCAAQAWL